ncbi:MAG: response regulator [Deltaproteobacteria bacterium]|jgi:response regulator RpfG family c-di-GMP phosphodiesterase|nr:response regulator [Deltaproteobacteria bacterium]
MSAKVMLMVENSEQRARLSEHLADKFAVSEGPVPDPAAGPNAPAEAILAASPDVVVMDYLSEDAFSVKVLQAVSDANYKIGFIFLDAGKNADLESVLMAINEGAQAFIFPDISKVALLNYVNRVVFGPSRLRRTEFAINEDELQRTNEKLTRTTTRLNNAQKLITYLLSTPLGSQPRKALILSDSMYQREMLKKHLEDNNFIVLTASSIADAVSLTLSEKPRIVVSDYELEEGKTGIDFCKELKFNQKFTPLYFVICTASQDKLSQIMTPGNGVDDCVPKPATPTSLNEFLARAALGLII